MGNLVQREQPYNYGGIGGGVIQEHKKAAISPKRCKIGPRFFVHYRWAAASSHRYTPPGFRDSYLVLGSLMLRRRESGRTPGSALIDPTRLVSIEHPNSCSSSYTWLLLAHIKCMSYLLEIWLRSVGLQPQQNAPTYIRSSWLISELGIRISMPIDY